MPKGPPYYGCTTNLFLGFFFDGTRNNYAASLKRKDHSATNVARLYEAYPGQSVAGVLPSSVEWPGKEQFKNFFRVYVPGVGTLFKEVNDSGEGADYLFGNACAALGERRIIWALVQAINCVHRFFMQGANLIDADRAYALSRDLQLGWNYLKAPPGDEWPTDDMLAANKQKLRGLLLELHRAIRMHIPDPDTGRPAKIDPGKVENIFISAFGFSRGATEARVFANWLVELCRLDAGLVGKPGLTLGGFPVTFDFLGLFDTVASVGLASSTLFADGHAAWADADVSLRIPDDVRRCVHLVAAHEVRRSFPLDSVHVRGHLPSQCEEIVFPGVHSDVGGGYLPCEQGRGRDGEGRDLLSRIALAIMYRAARLAGVPLKLEIARGDVKDSFRIKPEAIESFNAYLEQCRTREGTLTAIMREQRAHYILWRKQMLGDMASLPGTQSSLPEDRADLLGADKELEEEVSSFLRWREERAAPYAPAFDDDRQSRRTAPSMDPRHEEEWSKVAAFWDAPAPHPAIQALFNDYVHDSFAWFKITGTEAADLNKKMRELVNRRHVGGDFPGGDPYGDSGGSGPRPLTPEQKEWVDAYLKTGEYAPKMTTGREPRLMGAGYLRFRKIYAGADNWLLTRRKAAPQEERARLSEAA